MISVFWLNHLLLGKHIKGIKPKLIRPHLLKHRPNILYGIIRKAQPLRPPPIKRRVVAKIVEPRYDVVYPHGLGGELHEIITALRSHSNKLIHFCYRISLIQRDRKYCWKHSSIILFMCAWNHIAWEIATLPMKQHN